MPTNPRQTKVDEEEVGRLAFGVRKERAAERALARLRQGLGQSWGTLKADEIHQLAFVIGELYAYVPREQWEHLRFGRLTEYDVRKVLTLAGELIADLRPSVEVAEDVRRLVLGKE